ncbi:hypothetical protein C8Q75DRAFT_732047 [Abortiporus biennis]|nr:hypothetical protein C8Q75DRAFT_732047 [Abortiporus biennis]
MVSPSSNPTFTSSSTVSSTSTHSSFRYSHSQSASTPIHPPNILSPQKPLVHQRVAALNPKAAIQTKRLSATSGVRPKHKATSNPTKSSSISPSIHNPSQTSQCPPPIQIQDEDKYAIARINLETMVASGPEVVKQRLPAIALLMSAMAKERDKDIEEVTDDDRACYMDPYAYDPTQPPKWKGPGPFPNAELTKIAWEYTYIYDRYILNPDNYAKDGETEFCFFVRKLREQALAEEPSPLMTRFERDPSLDFDDELHSQSSAWERKFCGLEDIQMTGTEEYPQFEMN